MRNNRYYRPKSPDRDSVSSDSSRSYASADDQYLSAGESEGEGNTNDMHKSTSLGDAEQKPVSRDTDQQQLQQQLPVVRATPATHFLATPTDHDNRLQAMDNRRRARSGQELTYHSHSPRMSPSSSRLMLSYDPTMTSSGYLGHHHPRSRSTPMTVNGQGHWLARTLSEDAAVNPLEAEVKSPDGQYFKTILHPANSRFLAQRGFYNRHGQPINSEQEGHVTSDSIPDMMTQGHMFTRRQLYSYDEMDSLYFDDSIASRHSSGGRLGIDQGQGQGQFVMGGDVISEERDARQYASDVAMTVMYMRDTAAHQVPARFLKASDAKPGDLALEPPPSHGNKEHGSRGNRRKQKRNHKMEPSGDSDTLTLKPEVETDNNDHLQENEDIQAAALLNDQALMAGFEDEPEEVVDDIQVKEVVVSELGHGVDVTRLPRTEYSDVEKKEYRTYSDCLLPDAEGGEHAPGSASPAARNAATASRSSGMSKKNMSRDKGASVHWTESDSDSDAYWVHVDTPLENPGQSEARFYEAAPSSARKQGSSAGHVTGILTNGNHSTQTRNKRTNKHQHEVVDNARHSALQLHTEKALMQELSAVQGALCQVQTHLNILLSSSGTHLASPHLPLSHRQVLEVLKIYHEEAVSAINNLNSYTSQTLSVVMETLHAARRPDSTYTDIQTSTSATNDEFETLSKPVVVDVNSNTPADPKPDVNHSHKDGCKIM